MKLLNSKVLPARRVMIPIGIGLMLSLMGDQTLYTVLPNPDIAALAGLKLASVGLLLGINRLTRIVTNGPVGAFYDRAPRRWLMIASIFLGAFSTLCYAFGQGFIIMLLGRILWGFAWSGIWIGSNTMVMDISREENRGRISAQLSVWFLIGIAVSSFCGGLFTDLFGYRGGLFLSAGLTGLAGLIWLLFLPETRLQTIEIKEISVGQNQKFSNLPLKLSFKLSLVLFSLRFIFAGVLASTTILWLSRYVNAGINVGNFQIPLATLTGIVVAARVIFSVGGAPAAGAWSDRLGRRWGLVVGLMILGSGGVYLMSLPQFWVAIIGAFMAFFATSGVSVLISAIIGDQVRENQRSRVLGLVFSVGDLGSALGPWVALAIIPKIGLELVYQLSAGVGIVFSLFLLRNAIGEKVYWKKTQ
ncbi:MAG: MFS transporter [Anaerolineaceae bacterium]|nr:MFS transporter [Anaerolineaceae bacterium]